MIKRWDKIKTYDSKNTYIWNIRSLILSELFVVAQKEDGVFKGESVVEVTLSLSLCCALHLRNKAFLL